TTDNTKQGLIAGRPKKRKKPKVHQSKVKSKAMSKLDLKIVQVSKEAESGSKATEEAKLSTQPRASTSKSNVTGSKVSKAKQSQVSENSKPGSKTSKAAVAEPISHDDSPGPVEAVLKAGGGMFGCCGANVTEPMNEMAKKNSK